MARPKKDPKDRADNTISFKLGNELYAQLEKYGRSQRDDAGLPLNPALAARKLVREALERIMKSSKSSK